MTASRRHVVILARDWAIVAAVLLGSGSAQSPKPPPAMAVVAGSVREPDGSAVSGARVELRRRSDSFSAAPTPFTVTNPDGTFRIDGVSPGAYHVSVSRPAFVRTYYSKNQKLVDNPGDLLEVPAGGTIRLNFVVLRAGAISGRVIDPFGQPAVRAEVIASAVHQRSSSGGFDTYVPPLTTDVDGSYRLGGLEPGEYRVVAKLADMRAAPFGSSDGPTKILKPTYHPSTTAPEDAGLVAVTAGVETSGVDITMQLHPTYRITGQILGLPEGARVSISISSSEDRFTPTVTATGTFDSLEQVPAGRYEVIVRTTGRPAGPNLWAKADIVVSRNIENLVLAMQGTSTVTGLVVNAKGLPAENVSVGLIPLESSFNQGGGAFAIPSGKTNATGEFVITDLFPGSYRVIVTGTQTEFRTEASLTGTPLSDNTFEIPPGQSVSGLAIHIR